MLQENDYRVIMTHEGVLVFLIKAKPESPEKPFILYDGEEHATLYRRPDQTIALDYLNKQVLPVLQNSSKAVVFEMDDALEDISITYEVYIKHIKKNTFVEDL